MANKGEGMYSWQGSLYSIFDGKVIRDLSFIFEGTDDGAFFYFTETTGGINLVFKNSTNAYYINQSALNTVLEITDVDYPSVTVPGVAYLDGYMFVMTPNGEIHNSDTADAFTSWNSLGFIQANIEPDCGVFIFKQFNYICALGKYSIEFFYDAGLPAPGSPLAPVPNLFNLIGCASARSFARNGPQVFFMGQTKHVGRSIQLLEGYQLKNISNPYIERILNKDNLETVYAFCIRTVGHSFYILTLVNSNLTLCYDATSGIWYEWTSFNGTNEVYFNAVAYAAHLGHDLLQGETDANIYDMKPTLYQDNGQPIYVRSRTELLDVGENKRKELSFIDVIADKEASSTLQIKYTVNDYQSFTAFRNVDLSLERSSLNRCGQFRRIAFESLHTSNTPFRAEALELDILPGSS